MMGCRLWVATLPVAMPVVVPHQAGLALLRSVYGAVPPQLTPERLVAAHDAACWICRSRPGTANPPSGGVSGRRHLVAPVHVVVADGPFPVDEVGVVILVEHGPLVVVACEGADRVE